MDRRSLPREHEGGLERGHRRYFAISYALSALPRQGQQSEHRKDHVHLIVAFPNTTTYKHALNVMDLLSAEGKKQSIKCEAQSLVSVMSMTTSFTIPRIAERKAKNGTTRPSVSRAATSILVRMSSLAQPRRTKCSWRWDKLSETQWLHQLHGLL